MQNVFSKFKNHKLIIPTIIIAVALLISISIFSGFFDKIFIKRSFEKAFFYRAVGNCDAFVQYVAKDQDKWRDRCVEEKKREGTAIPIKDFKVLRVDYIRQDRKAFLQVQLTRDEKSYVVNYEVVKEGLFNWKITNEI